MDPLYGIHSPFILAPMHGLNYPSFRLLCKDNGAHILFTPMHDINALARMDKKKAAVELNIQESERPIIAQLIGRDQKLMRKAISLVDEFADGINLNAGCIEKAYLDRGCGASLMQDHEKLFQLVRSMRHATEKPLSVKIRAGWDNQSIQAVAISQGLEKAGTDMVIIHGRTAEQKYAGRSNWVIMRQAKEKTTIPIIANGDVTSYQEGLVLIEKTGCDGVMIGREAKYRPWVFRNAEASKDYMKKQLHTYLEYIQRYDRDLPLGTIKDILFRMTRDIETTKDKWEIKKLSDLQSIRCFIRLL